MLLQVNLAPALLYNIGINFAEIIVAFIGFGLYLYELPSWQGKLEVFAPLRVIAERHF